MNTSKIYLLLGIFVAAANTASAQDSYDAQTLSQSDLNGTSRFVGMGGALGALGGDISVMSTNPAGTGLKKDQPGKTEGDRYFRGQDQVPCQHVA